MEEVGQKDGRLQELEDVDKKIIAVLTAAGTVLAKMLHTLSGSKIGTTRLHLSNQLVQPCGAYFRISCLTELSKEKPVMKNAENHSSNFLKGLEEVDKVLSQKISHLGQISSGGTHEGTHYDCAKEREITLRCSQDVQSNLGFLFEERKKFLLETKNETFLSQNVDEPMNSPETRSS